MGIIFFFSSRASVEISPDNIVNFLFFKTLHLMEYAVLFALFFRAIKYSFPREKSIYWYACALGLIICYACTDEIHQLFVPTREGRLRDVIIDGLGAGIAWITIQQLLPKAPKKLRAQARKWQVL
jgi:VanZ family protein